MTKSLIVAKCPAPSLCICKHDTAINTQTHSRVLWCFHCKHPYFIESVIIRYLSIIHCLSHTLHFLFLSLLFFSGIDWKRHSHGEKWIQLPDGSDWSNNIRENKMIHLSLFVIGLKRSISFKLHIAESCSRCTWFICCSPQTSNPLRFGEICA